MDVQLQIIGRETKITVKDVDKAVICPFCKAKVIPQLEMPLFAYKSYPERYRFLAIFPCCNHEHIVSCSKVDYFDDLVYPRADAKWEAEELHKEILKFKEIPGIIDDISPSFRQIYEEAQAAAQLGYTQICGGGYRKALEFLIKDYATFLHPDKDKEIAKMELGNCIKKYIDNPSIQIYANRASWLGNDELHYRRYWENKDIFDLGALIEASILAIRIEEEGKKLEIEMPKPPKK